MKAWGQVHRTHVNTQVWRYIPVISALGRMILGDRWPAGLHKWVNSRFRDILHLRTLGRECLKKHLVWTPGLHMHVHAYTATPTSLYAQTHRLWEIHTHLLKFSSTHTLWAHTSHEKPMHSLGCCRQRQLRTWVQELWLGVPREWKGQRHVLESWDQVGVCYWQQTEPSVYLLCTGEGVI